MDVIINAELGVIPENASPLKSHATATLNLLASLGYDAANPPLADLLKRLHNLEGTWLIISPIHWEASHNNAMIVAVDNELGLDDTQAKHWFGLFSQFLAEDGLTLYYHDAQTWLLRVDGKPPVNAKPVYQIINHPLMLELVQLDASMYWQKLFTESQMFFASLPNQSLLNGVWLWGGAPLSDKQAITICADQASMAVAQCCSSKVSLYNPALRLKDYQIVLVNTLDSLSEHHQEELKKLSPRWFWNNTAYTKTTNWFTRFWRTLIHAH